MSTETQLPRSLRVDLMPTGETKEERGRKKWAIINFIRQYRAELRRAYSLFSMAQMAGATIESTEDDFRVIPNEPRAKLILETVTGKGGKAPAYALREDVLARNPTWYSWVFDALRSQLQTTWTAKDPELTRARRSWLTLNGRRGTNVFNRAAIIFPALTTDAGRVINNVIIPRGTGYRIELRLNKQTQENMDFRFVDLDARSGRTWRLIRDGLEGYELRTLRLTEQTDSNGSDLVVFFSYLYPAKSDILPMTRTLRVMFLEHPTQADPLFMLMGPDEHQEWRYDAAGVLQMLSQHTAHKNAVDNRKRACGSPKQPWGHRKGWLKYNNQLMRLTENFSGRKADFNRSFARLISDRARQWSCGTVEITRHERICGQPWAWYELQQFLEAKGAEYGFAVKINVIRPADQQTD